MNMVSKQRRAGALVSLWSVVTLVSVTLSPFTPIALGIAIGSIVTAIVLGISVKLMTETISEQMMSAVDDIDTEQFELTD